MNFNFIVTKIFQYLCWIVLLPNQLQFYFLTEVVGTEMKWYRSFVCQVESNEEARKSAVAIEQ